MFDEDMKKFLLQGPKPYIFSYFRPEDKKNLTVSGPKPEVFFAWIRGHEKLAGLGSKITKFSWSRWHEKLDGLDET